VAEHADAEDAAQSVTFEVPEDIEIDTTLHVTGSDSHEVATLARARITDTVTFAGLTPGETYTLTGLIMDRSTGEPVLMAASDKAETEAKGSEGDGNDTKAAAADTTTLPDSATVWVEAGGTYHADLTCDHVGGLVGLRRTTAGAARAAGKAPCAHEAKATAEATSGATGATDAEGTVVAAKATFVPKAPAGSAEVTFELDTTGLQGHDLVAFEDLKAKDGTTIASHHDLDDADQTVRVTASEAASSAGSAASPAAGAPATATTSGGTLAQTGRGGAPVLVALVGCGLAVAGMRALWSRRGRASGSDQE